MNNVIIFEALAIFAIWMQRGHRWEAFFKAATGQYVVYGSSRASQTQASVAGLTTSSASSPSTGTSITSGPTTSGQVPGTTTPGVGPVTAV